MSVLLVTQSQSGGCSVSPEPICHPLLSSISIPISAPCWVLQQTGVGLGCFPIPKPGPKAPLNSGPYLTQCRVNPVGPWSPCCGRWAAFPGGPCSWREMSKCLCFHVPFHPAPLPQQPSVTEKLHLPSLQEPKPNLSSLSRRRAAPSPPTRATCPARSPAAPPGPKMPRPAATRLRAWRAPR